MQYDNWTCACGATGSIAGVEGEAESRLRKVFAEGPPDGPQRLVLADPVAWNRVNQRYESERETTPELHPTRDWLQYVSCERCKWRMLVIRRPSEDRI